MKTIIRLSVDYLEKALISMTLLSLAFISVSGWLYKAQAEGTDAYASLPKKLAICAMISLILIGCVEIVRRGRADDQSASKAEYFQHIRLFYLFLTNGLANTIIARRRGLRHQGIARLLGGLSFLIVIGLIIYTLGQSFYISADINLKENQAIASANLQYEATFFNRSLIIAPTEISGGAEPQVSAVLHSDGYDDVVINKVTEGYETTYIGPRRFTVKVNKITPSMVFFFVERLPE
jgi:hypothetical protein